MNGLIAWWARNTVAANLLMLFIIVAGIVGYNKLEREIDPKVNFTGLAINAFWPGASPKEIEEQIVSKIEERLSDLDNVDWIRSESSEGFAGIYVRGDVRNSEVFETTMNEVKSRIDSISSFPRDMEPPRVSRWENSQEFIRIGLHGDLSEKELTRLGQVMRREVANLPAISKVGLFGTRQEEVSIEVSEDALRRYNLTFSQVASAIRSSSVNLSSGTIRTNAGELRMITRNMANTKSAFSDIIIRQTDSGATIRVGDVATVIDGFEDNPILATMNGDPAVLIQVMTTEIMDVVTASNGVKEWIKERSKTLPAGAKLTLWDDAAETFEGRIETISSAAFAGLGLVMIVLLLTLRPKVAFWVCTGIATAYFGAFVLMDAVGVSLNMISTFAFLLVLGIVVDDAIVVGESIHHESSSTGGGLSAAILGTQLVAKPVIFAVLTTILAFLPWIFITGETSEFTRHITWVVILALAFSLIESLLILPAHLSKMKPRENKNAFDRVQKKIADSIINFANTVYRRIGNWVVRKRYLVLLSFIGLFVTTFSLQTMGYVKFGFMPEIESDQISVNIDFPQGTTYETSLRILKKVQDAEKQLIDEAKAESADIELIENWYTRSRRDSVLALIKLSPPELRGEKSAKEISLRLRELIGEIPEAEEVNVNYTFNNSSPSVQFAVRHNDLDLLNSIVNEVEDKLRTFDEAFDVRNNLQSAGQEMSMELLPGAQKLGLTLTDVSRQVRQAYFGEEVQRLPREGTDVRVYVRYPLESRRNMESLENFRIRTPNGSEVPLTAIVDLKFQQGISRILHWDRDRAAIVTASLKTEERQTIMKDMNENFWPDMEAKYPGLKRGAIGNAEGERKFFEEIQGLYTLVLFGMYMLLAIAFKSYSQPILILVAIPFAYIGAVLGHFVMGDAMALFSYFGIAAAAGVVVNDNLVLVDYYNRLKDRGMEAREAIVEAGVVRFRPIMLTTVTTCVGLMPMMAEKSIQAAFLKPVVISLAFGVLIAFFVTLMLVPAMCSIGVDIQRFKAWFMAPWREGKEAATLTKKSGDAPAE
ncbi:efflux RND transporter permease subunit [Temperatibacter marinus]|uniref:Efflux RND transporter permease subunit n=1 Tax=Temperatibacter marinus TaxID=1456591 RepID=A0AA52EAV9_9PROT|nr:efflux RND transporter permease subunit [Temperatibacter marinus]WND01456.1 efflux RND transporter permease subunit [Temperatibacter marinus]